ncbi:type II toxin-antitoxin system RelE family toxin [Wolbachia endosymbiont of Rhagoletis indifferens]|uniref:type II toxin-antitoxin system RelE family toxin n=1 Tax=unclassified Wolbachia TaxID=2640676 RepID=UPI00222FF515|nr:type II toxin-antitoxin system RelE/ParE family toxin [Wolbachia endosymbiont (group A) of Bibio marci]
MSGLQLIPINLGEALNHSLKGRRRLRVGDYRIIYHVNTVEYEVTIVTVGHRDTIYEKARKILSKHKYIFIQASFLCCFLS